jgi:hypothetical protein
VRKKGGGSNIEAVKDGGGGRKRRDGILSRDFQDNRVLAELC